MFKKNSNLEQIWVYGNSYESALVAVVVPAEVRRPFLQLSGIGAPLVPDARCTCFASNNRPDEGKCEALASACAN